MKIQDQRTGQQNKSIHKFCGMLSEALNDAGLDVMTTLRHDVAIPWTPERVKELIWRPVQQVMTGKESTTELDRIEPNQVWEVINRHMGEKHGIHVPFPCEDDR